MNEKQQGKCSFYRGSCPTFWKGDCIGCLGAHKNGDCYTRDRVLRRQFSCCGAYSEFPVIPDRKSVV